MIPSFFLNGDDCEPAYLYTRDLPDRVEWREFIEYLWRRYFPAHDDHFLIEAKNNFHQRFWEMYLFAALQDMNLDPVKGGKAGPDFSVVLGGRRYWIEAVAPKVGTSPDRVPEPGAREDCRSPLDEIQLRYAGALSYKFGRWNGWLKDSIVSADDGFVLAMNGWEFNKYYDGYPPLFIRACLGIGHQAIAIDPTSLKVVDSYLTLNESITKKSGGVVSTAPLLSPVYSPVSGILHSLGNFTHQPASLMEGMEFLHGPLATNQFPDLPIQCLRRFTYSDSQLTKMNPIPPWPENPVLEMD